jgi:Phage integrase family
VFPNPVTGEPLDPSALLRRFKDALKRAEVRAVRFHDLRHSFGTCMAAAGVPIRTLQKWMGHSNIQTTHIYADYQPSEHEAEFVRRAFAGHKEDVRVRAYLGQPIDLALKTPLRLLVTRAIRPDDRRPRRGRVRAVAPVVPLVVPK